MWRITRVLGVGLLLMSALTSASRGGTITYGNTSLGEVNTFPFGGSYQTVWEATEYQQVYSGTQFGSGAFAINSVSFFNGPNVSALADGTYVISISTTPAAVGALDSNMANNIGADDETFFNGTLPSSVGAGGLLTFTLATPFNYNPANGNLLLDFQISGVTSLSSPLFASQNSDFGTLSSRMVNGLASNTTGWGLVTQFNFTGASVPEPPTLPMAVIAIVSVGAFARHHRRQRRPRGA
jgi:hypothetical protein